LGGEPGGLELDSRASTSWASSTASAASSPCSWNRGGSRRQHRLRRRPGRRRARLLLGHQAGRRRAQRVTPPEPGDARRRPGVSVLCPGWVRTRINDASRNRPAGAGPPSPMTPELEAAEQMIRHLVETGAEPAAIAGQVVEAIREGRFYVLTHPEMKGAISSAGSRTSSPAGRRSFQNSSSWRLRAGRMSGGWINTPFDRGFRATRKALARLKGKSVTSDRWPHRGPGLSRRRRLSPAHGRIQPRPAQATQRQHQVDRHCPEPEEVAKRPDQRGQQP